MNRRYTVAVAVLGIAACTTPGPEATVAGVAGETSMMAGSQTVAAAATEQVDTPAVPVRDPIADDNVLICTKERVTGSRIPTKVCLTRKERERIREVSQGYMEGEKQKPGSNPSR